jgi:RNAse (barnase) inhibitor barstar
MTEKISLLKLLPNVERAGVYQSTITADEIVAAAKTLGLHVFKLDIASARGKSGILERFAKALRFPDYFGKNWDALNDCLSDLSWLDGKGWVLIVANGKAFAENYQGEFNVAIDILNRAVESWREQGKPFWVLVQAQDGWHPELAKIVDSE